MQCTSPLRDIAQCQENGVLSGRTTHATGFAHPRYTALIISTTMLPQGRASSASAISVLAHRASTKPSDGANYR